MSAGAQKRERLPTVPTQPFRLDVPLHDLLRRPEARPRVVPVTAPQTLPEPVFPQHPELLHEIDEADIAAHGYVRQKGHRRWGAAKILHTMHGWMFPYFKSRIRQGDFQPIIAYLFTE